MQIPQIPSLTNLTNSVPNAVTADIKSFLDLLPFNTKPTPISTPYPAPVKNKPVLPTSFELSPFIEKTLVNPYKTKPLGILSEAELAIDNVVSYVENLLPPELLKELSNLPDLAKHLLQQGMSLDTFLTSLKNKLPSMLNLPSLLRDIGVGNIMSFVGNVNSFVSTITSMGLSLHSLPSTFTSQALRFMSDMHHMVDIKSYSNQFSAISNLSSLFGNSSSMTPSSPVAQTAIALATVDLTLDSQPSVINTLTRLGVPNPVIMVPLIKVMTANDFKILATATQILGIPVTSSVLTTTKNLGVATTTALINSIGDVNNATNVALLTFIKDHQAEATLLSKAPAAVSLIASSMQSYGITAVSNISATITTVGITKFVDGVTALNNVMVAKPYTILEVQNILTSVKSIGVAAYISTYGTGDQNLLDLVTQYGIDTMIILANSLALTNVNNVVDLANAIVTTGPASTQTLITMATNTSAAALNTIITTIYTGATNLTASLQAIATVDVASVLSLAIATSVLTTNGALALITAVDISHIDLAIANLGNLAVLSAAAIGEIADLIALSDPTAILVNDNITGVFLAYAIRKAAELASKKGDYLSVVNILKGYSGNITVDYRRYLISNLLASYRNNSDDTCMGAVTASRYFAEGLNYIYSGWQSDHRGGAMVTLHTPWLTASPDAIDLLLHYPDTAIPAILQKDNNYALH